MGLGTKVKLSAKTDVVFALIQFKIYCLTKTYHIITQSLVKLKLG